MKKLRFSLYVLIFFLFYNNTFPASISGRITFKNRKPVVNLKIICESGYDTYVTYTNESGDYYFWLSNNLYVPYMLYIEFKSGQRKMIGRKEVRGEDYTIDVELNVNKIR